MKPCPPRKIPPRKQPALQGFKKGFHRLAFSNPYTSNYRFAVSTLSPDQRLKVLVNMGEKETTDFSHPLELQPENDTTKPGNETSSHKEDDVVAISGFQYGTQSAQASNFMRTRRQLIMLYVVICLVQFVQSFSNGIVCTLTPYFTSSFGKHSLTATTSIIASLVSGLGKLALTKMIDLCGRPQGFISDMSTLRNRALWIGILSSSSLGTVWEYGPTASSILNKFGLHWEFGIMIIVVPIPCAPLIAIFYYHQYQAIKQGFVVKTKDTKNLAQSIIYYFWEFDVIGLLLLTIGLGLFLLSLWPNQPDRWKSPLIISSIVIGGILTIVFIGCEAYLAPVPFIPWDILKDRRVAFTYAMRMPMYAALAMWQVFFYSMLIVVWNQSVTPATYIQNIMTALASFVSICTGISLHYGKRVKWLAAGIGMPLNILSSGVLIYFRQDTDNVGYVYMYLVLGGFAAASWQSVSSSPSLHGFDSLATWYLPVESQSFPVISHIFLVSIKGRAQVLKF
ncbi:hypothetical protein G7046_g6217 [Stylonectria norvegica]|nr:hypothetical protein G7046_g6217 [Stylonectria norvegica]